jgi:hypothetical protein
MEIEDRDVYQDQPTIAVLKVYSEIWIISESKEYPSSAAGQYQCTSYQFQ